jgi:hypothetical protein
MPLNPLQNGWFFPVHEAPILATVIPIPSPQTSTTPQILRRATHPLFHALSALLHPGIGLTLHSFFIK